VLCSWVDDACHSQLLDARKALKEGMLYNVEEQAPRYSDKPKYWVIDYFEVVHRVQSYD